MDRHGLYVGDDNRHTALREARRFVWTQDRPAGRNRPVSHWVGAVWPESFNGRVDRVPCAPGSWRRRPDGHDDGGDRRYHPPARARALSRHLWRCIRPFDGPRRSEEHTSELQSLMRISYAVFCLKKKKIAYAYPSKMIQYNVHNPHDNNI